MAHSASPHWQPVEVSAAARERAASPPTASNKREASPPPPYQSRTNTGFSPDLKRLGASLSWKTWKSSKSRADSSTSLSTLPACNHGWKPYTMRKRVLLPMAIFTAILAASVEVLAQRSLREGGLSLARTAEEISNLEEFKYEFLSTIIAVILSIAWTWVDLDVKRMQPWLEMSREGGARVQDSLILDYPYDFVAYVPFKAGKRRHWTVFVSGTVMVLIFWVITPLQGAIFGKGSVQLREPVTFYESQDLLPIEDQSKAIDTSILHHMYAIKYLDQPFPAFTTPEYALRPFKLETDPNRAAKNWTAKTTKFWTDLNCEPAESITQDKREAWKGYYEYNNGKGCNASTIYTVGNNDKYIYQMHYLAWYTSAYAAQAFGVPTCPSEFSNQFLAITSKGTEDKAEVTGLFCETSYWKQRVTVTVPDSSFHPDNSSITPDGPVEELPRTEFNATGFEFVLGSSVSEVQGDAKRDYPDNLILNLFDKFNGTGVQTPVSPMVGFAIGGMERPIEDFRDETVLGEAYRAIHKYAFSLTYSDLLTEETASKEKSEGKVEFVMHGVIVSRVFSALVEGLLLSVGACCILLLVLSSRMKSNLSSNPAALSDQMEVLKNSHGLLDSTSQDTSILKANKGTGPESMKLHLQCACKSPEGATTIKVVGLPSSPPSSRSESRNASDRNDDDQFTPMRPIVLRKRSGFVFSVLLTACLAGLLVLRIKEQKLNGLQRPTDKFEVLQLLENYIPMAISTLIEPYWVLVNRLLCVFQPYNTLQNSRKESHAKGAMRARYASLPPQLSVWTAARSGHIVLSVACVVALLGNVLAVGLGGLFNEDPIRTSYPVDLQFQQSHKLDVDGADESFGTMKANDNFFSMKANITFGTRMPPWVVRDYYFQPFAASSPSEKNSTESFAGRTRGYGLDLWCDKMEPRKRLDQYDEFDIRPLKERLGSWRRDCPNFLNVTVPGDTKGPSAIEGTDRMCNGAAVFWGRSAGSPDTDRDMHYFYCQPLFKTALFDVSVDAEGHISSYNQTGDFDNDLGYDLSRNHTDTVMGWSTRGIGEGPARWHNGTFSEGWLGDMLKATGEGWVLDPSEPLPEPSKVLPLVAGIWRWSFVYLLANADLVKYAPVEDGQASFTGTRSVTETRIFMSDAAFIVSAAVLALYILVAIVLYSLNIMPPLPRMPTSIGAILQFTAPSRALREYTPESDGHLRFGRYIGRDRKRNVGIEYSELVMPVGPGSSRQGEKSTKFGWGRLRRRHRTRDERGPDTNSADTSSAVESRADTSRDESREDTRREDMSRESTSREDTGREDTNREDTNREDTGREDTKREGTSKEARER